MANKKYRLVTRSDFDGLVCATLLKELDILDEIKFVHPKDMQDGKIEISGDDITTNLPYVPQCHLAFDHHDSEILRVGAEKPDNWIIDADAPSAARVVYTHYGAKARFPRITDELMEAVDKADSADYVIEDILDPKGWTLLNFIMDPRTGLGRFREFRVSNYQLMENLVDYCVGHSIEEILQTPDVRERVELYQSQQLAAREQIKRCTKVYDNVVVLNLQNEPIIYATNRFTIYAMYPSSNVSIHLLMGRQGKNSVIAMGKSIINRSSKTDLGSIALRNGGGGHANAATCQIEHTYADRVLNEIVNELKETG